MSTWMAQKTTEAFENFSRDILKFSLIIFCFVKITRTNIKVFRGGKSFHAFSLSHMTRKFFPPGKEISWKHMKMISFLHQLSLSGIFHSPFLSELEAFSLSPPHIESNQCEKFSFKLHSLRLHFISRLEFSPSLHKSECVSLSLLFFEAFSSGIELFVFLLSFTRVIGRASA